MAKQRRFRMKKVPSKAHLGTLRVFKNFYNLNNKELERIVTEGPVTDPSVEKIRRNFEAAVFTDFNKYFTKGNMATLSKDVPPQNAALAKVYNKIKESKDTTTMKTVAQREAVKKGRLGNLQEHR